MIVKRKGIIRGGRKGSKRLQRQKKKAGRTGYGQGAKKRPDPEIREAKGTDGKVSRAGGVEKGAVGKVSRAGGEAKGTDRKVSRAGGAAKGADGKSSRVGGAAKEEAGKLRRDRKVSRPVGGSRAAGGGKAAGTGRLKGGTRGGGDAKSQEIKAPGRSKRKEQIADLFDVHWRTVLNWAREGCPHDKQGRKPYLFDEMEVAGWLKGHEKTCRPGRPAKEASKETDEWKLRKERALAETYEMTLAEKRGELVSVRQVEEERIRRVLAVKTGLLGLIRAVPADSRSVVSDRVHELLRIFADEHFVPRT